MNDIECQEIVEITTEDCELIGVRIKLNKQFFEVFSYYSPPDVVLKREIFQIISQRYKNYVIMGDINAKTPQFNNVYNVKGRVLDDIIASTNAHIMIDKMDPTNFHFKTIKGRLTPCHAMLDYFIGSHTIAEKVHEYKILRNKCMIPYEKKYFHLPIVLELNIKRSVRINNNSKNESYLYQKADWNLFMKQQNSLIRCKSIANDFDEESKFICACLNDADGIAIPKGCKVSDKPIRYPNHIVSLFNVVKFWQRQHEKRKTDVTRENLYNLKETLKRELIKFKSSQWQSFLDRMGPHMLSTIPFWKRINRYKNKKRSKVIGTLMFEDVEVTTDSGKAELFSDRLYKTFNEDSSTNHRYDSNWKTQVDKFFETNQIEKEYSDEQKIAFKKITAKEFECAVNRINNKTSTDMFGISNQLLKNTSNVMRVRIINLFNRCLTEKSVPDSWKHSVVMMIPKKKEGLKEPGNYRLISKVRLF